MRPPSHPSAPTADCWSISEPPGDYDIDDLADDLAARVPAGTEEVVELEAALGYLHERLDPACAAVFATALELIADRHVLVVRGVARSLMALSIEASLRYRAIRVEHDERVDDCAATVAS
ncbi:MAG: hypothetical protein ACHREM_23680 [Polyangiales bacterium]